MIPYTIRKNGLLTVLRARKSYNIETVTLQRAGYFTHTWGGFFTSRPMSAWR